MKTFQPITSQEILSSSLVTTKGQQWAINKLEYLNKPMKLFGSSQKVEKGSDKFTTYILYLAPADLVSSRTLCSGAVSSGCYGPCLYQSGQLGMTTGTNAMFKRTILMLLRPEWFETALLSEIDKAENKAKRDNIPALFRLNGTSDIDFSYILKQRPHSMAYDYTKVLSRIRKNTLPNYDLTFSGSMYSEQSKNALRKAVQRKHRIAISFNTKESKKDTFSIPTHLKSFDDTDLRHLDANGTIGALKRKGSSIAERIIENSKKDSFFVTQSNLDQFNDIIAVSK